MRILIVDDSEDSRDITEAALLSGGYPDIVLADSARGAFQFLEVGRDAGAAPAAADIILLDIMMPEIYGIEACARIRSDARHVDVPIIMVTSMDDMDSLANAFVAGATDYVTKPINRTELIARVRAALKLKAELDRRKARERELLDFLSQWGNRYAKGWIDGATGLFLAEVAEAYLTAVSERYPQQPMSVLALAVDRLDVLRAAKGERTVNRILAHVAGVVRDAAAAIGVVAAVYNNGLVIVIAPRLDREASAELAQRLRAAVARLSLANSEALDSDTITASVSVATGSAATGSDRVNLLTRAIMSAERDGAAGANRVAIVSV